MVKITGVEPHSYAKRCGIKTGDILFSINGNEINDVLDYRFYLTEKNVNLKLKRIKRKEKEYFVNIKKDDYEDIGLDFETPLMDKKHSCKNGCIFCFIDQNPKGMRESIYFKDDDSRLSFIHGNYITLTNMTDDDVARIIKMRMSPINISVHTTNPELRVKMMKNKNSGKVLKYLQDFKNADLSMCGQIVLCRGVNDGEELKRTLNDLTHYYPQMKSVAIVPAGLTKYRDGLYPLADFTKEEASAVIDMVDSIADSFKKLHGSRMFFVSDELYLKAERPLPKAEYYEGYSQLEDGVGMLRSFFDEFNLAVEDIEELSESLKTERKVTVAVGVASYSMIKEFSDKLCALCPNLTVKVKKIVNNFFGNSITVSGLLTGRDIYEQVKGEELGEELLISKTCLKADEDIFLCGMTKKELSQKLGVPVTTVNTDGYAFAEAVLGVADYRERKY